MTLLEPPHVGDDVDRHRVSAHDRVADELAGAVPGDLAAAVDVDDRGAVGGPLVRLGALAGGVDRGVLEQQRRCRAGRRRRPGRAPRAGSASPARSRRGRARSRGARNAWAPRYAAGAQHPGCALVAVPTLGSAHEHGARRDPTTPVPARAAPASPSGARSWSSWSGWSSVALGGSRAGQARRGPVQRQLHLPAQERRVHARQQRRRRPSSTATRCPTSSSSSARRRSADPAGPPGRHDVRRRHPWPAAARDG